MIFSCGVIETPLTKAATRMPVKMGSQGTAGGKFFMFLYILDLVGVAVFAVSGALAAGRLELDLLGVVVLASVTAIGGGTLRDLLMDRHPVFWIADSRYLAVILVAALLTFAGGAMGAPAANALLIADALGLALFAITGAQVAEGRGLSPLIAVLMGTMTASAGGVLRDVLAGVVPLLLRKDIYASAAVAGIVLYLVLQRTGVKREVAFGAGIAAVAGIRLAAIAYGWQLPVFRLAG
jgi:uncharacterized membrane protein YeiH